jgi:diamine N-acetyltransferase
MKIEGEHIAIRSLRMSDAEHLFRWENDESIWSVSGRSEALELELIQDYIRGVRDIYLDKQLRFIITENDHPIGTIDLFQFDQERATAGIGILIGEMDARGSGYAKEALALLVDYCKLYLGIRHLDALVPEENEASLRLFKGQGFHEVDSIGGIRSLRLELEEEE